MATWCNSCSKPLTGSKYYDVIYRDARDHDREEKIDEMQNKSRRSEEHDKEKKIQAYRAEIKDLDDDELDELLESLRAELEELKEKLKPKTNEEKQERESRLEHIGVDSSLINTRYHVLTLDQSHSSTPGDKLMIKLGSRDDDTVSDTSGDELLKSLGSSD